MNGGKITVEVGLSVSDETAVSCMYLLQLYLKDNPDKYLEFTINDSGETEFHIREKGNGDGLHAGEH